MAFVPFQPIHIFTLRKWVEMTKSIEEIIPFCQNVGLIPLTHLTPCVKGHENWYLGRCSRSPDKHVDVRKDPKETADRSARLSVGFSCCRIYVASSVWR